MSAEEWIYNTYGGVSSDDLTDIFGNEALYAGKSTCTNYERVSRSTHTHNPYNKKLPYIAKHEVKSNHNSRRQTMKTSLINRRVVEVRFEERGTLSEKSYAYFTDIEDLKPSDYVCVVVGDTPKIVVVTKVHGLSEDSKSKACKWIAFRVDLLDYYIKVKQDELITQIEEELDAEMNRVSRLEVLRSCAKNSKVMQSLLSKLEELNPNVKLLDGDSNV